MYISGQQGYAFGFCLRYLKFQAQNPLKFWTIVVFRFGYCVSCREPPPIGGPGLWVTQAIDLWIRRHIGV